MLIYPPLGAGVGLRGSYLRAEITALSYPLTTSLMCGASHLLLGRVSQLTLTRLGKYLSISWR